MRYSDEKSSAWTTGGRARTYLADFVMPVAGVAYLTGSSEVSAFSRAAWRRFGQTPGGIRFETATQSATGKAPSAIRG